MNFKHVRWAAGAVLVSALRLVAEPPGSGSWNLTGALVDGRAGGHTSALLNNGRVLVAGGTALIPGGGVIQYSAFAEVYDPDTRTWKSTGTLTTGRYNHTATVLHGGKVLVTGGNGFVSGIPSTLASAELYDPSTGTWTITGSMSTARAGHRANLLQDGRVLVIGGTGSAGALASTEIYDPHTGTWTGSGSMSVPRGGQFTATLLNNGAVMVVGGPPLVELYDPHSGGWSITGNLNTSRQNHTATLLHGGEVLVAGGSGPAGGLSSAEIYNPHTGTWKNTGNLHDARFFHTATLLNNGLVLVAAGEASLPPPQFVTALTSAELYDPKEGTWTVIGSLGEARFWHTAELLHGGGVLVVGGIPGSYSAETFGR